MLINFIKLILQIKIRFINIFVIRIKTDFFIFALFYNNNFYN